MRIRWLGGSRVQNLYAEGRLDHMDMTGGEPTAWWRIDCSQCHTDFVTWDTRCRYCSDECRTEGKRARTRARVAAHRAKTRPHDAEVWMAQYERVEVIESNPDAVTVTLTRDELMIISNALNVVCDGVDLDHDAEFSSRVGATRSEAQTLLANIHAAIPQ
jgi:hypothetical protein